MRVTGIAVFAVLPVVALAWLPAPFLVIAGVYALVLLARVRPNRRRRRGPVYFCLALALLAFAGVETLFLVRAGYAPSFRALVGAEDFTVPDPVLGRTPRPGALRRWRAEQDGRVIFDVEYAIGEDGLRREAPRTAPPREGSILFFGGSFTFGDGLPDDATLPWQTAVLLDGRYRARNFGLSGRGPNHMLAAIEHGLVAALVKERPRFAVYSAIAAHVGRVNARQAWDPGAPRYVAGADGTPIHAGRFDDPGWPPERPLGRRLELFLRRQLRKSYLLRKLVAEEPEGEAEVALWADVVAAARTRLERDHPGLAFHVLLWDSPYVAFEPMLAALEARHVHVHRVSRILPGFATDPRAYALDPADLHPSARANALLAAYVVREIVGPPRPE